MLYTVVKVNKGQAISCFLTFNRLSINTEYFYPNFYSFYFFSLLRSTEEIYTSSLNEVCRTTSLLWRKNVNKSVKCVRERDERIAEMKRKQWGKCCGECLKSLCFSFFAQKLLLFLDNLANFRSNCKTSLYYVILIYNISSS